MEAGIEGRYGPVQSDGDRGRAWGRTSCTTVNAHTKRANTVQKGKKKRMIRRGREALGAPGARKDKKSRADGREVNNARVQRTRAKNTREQTTWKFARERGVEDE